MARVFCIWIDKGLYLQNVQLVFTSLLSRSLSFSSDNSETLGYDIDWFAPIDELDAPNLLSVAIAQ